MEKMQLVFKTGSWEGGRKVGNITVKEIKNSYNFRGPINLTHLCNDCIRDGKHGFIAIGDDVIMGISKQLTFYDDVFKSLHTIKSGPDLAFQLFKLEKKEIPWAISFLCDIEKKIKKQIREVAKQIAQDKKAGKFSNAKQTKVLVF